MAPKLPSLIAAVHLPALPGAPGAWGVDPASALQAAGFLAVQEARALQSAGFQGIILENFGDAPFYKDQVPPETLASLAIIVAAVRESTKLQVGINVLRNDARAALAIAAVTGSSFIRVNVISGVAATDQGIIEGRAAELLRERDRLGAPVGILADIHVKHARTLSSESVELAVEEAVLRARADGVIVTGPTTGRAVDLEKLAEAGRACKKLRAGLWVGSGATPENLAELKRHAGGVIVGSALRRGGKAGAPLEQRRMREFARAFMARAPRRVSLKR